MPTDPSAPFGDLLRRTRRAAGLTQAELAERAGLSCRGVNDLERGVRRRPRKDTVALLAAALGLAGEERAAFEVAAHPPARASPGFPPPLNPVDRHAHNLPVQLSSFVGRERELAELKPLLLSSRLLTLTGPGGIGKTRLALSLAAGALEQFADGVWLVELAPLADPALVPQKVAAALGLRDETGRPILDVVRDYLRPKTLLLVLDNCEHLIEACAQLAETLLRAAPSLRILASSREALGIAGETAYRVPSLPLPDTIQPDRPHDLDALARNDCVRLFVARAASTSPLFRLTARNAPAIAQIGRRLDGIPLALELAAVRTKVLPPEQIAARLDDRFRLLKGGSRTALPRHQTLLALFEWSHDLLSEAERVLLRRLSVFAGGWSLEAAQAVCGDGLGEDVLETLEHLADKSLIDVATPIDAAEGRYHLLETIRQYARAKLLAAGEAERVRDRHLEYVAQLAEAAEPHLRRAEQMAWVERLEREHDNLRTALAWALESGKWEGALRLAGALYYFWELRGYWSEGHKWLNDALALAEREPGERGLAGRPCPDRPRADMAWRAKALYGAARTRFEMLFEPATSRTIVEESLRLWRQLGDMWWMAVALEHLGFMLSVGGDVQTAHARLEEGVSLAREVEDHWPLAVCLVRLGSFFPLTETAAARSIRVEAVTVARSVGDKSVLSQGLFGLGTDHLLEGNLTAAARVAEEALAEARAIGSVMHVLLSLLVLVISSCFQGDLAKAHGYCLQALALARETGSYQWFVLVQLGFGLVACFGGQPLRGVRLLAATETLARQLGINIRVEGMRDLMVAKQALDAALETARAHLDPATFESAWAEGQQQTMEQIMEQMRALATDVVSADEPLSEARRGPDTD